MSYLFTQKIYQIPSGIVNKPAIFVVLFSRSFYYLINNKMFLNIFSFIFRKLYAKATLGRLFITYDDDGSFQCKT